jgi:hypothetical protein
LLLLDVCEQCAGVVYGVDDDSGVFSHSPSPAAPERVYDEEDDEEEDSEDEDEYTQAPAFAPPFGKPKVSTTPYRSLLSLTVRQSRGI